jgi:hypothetical protein
MMEAADSAKAFPKRVKKTRANRPSSASNGKATRAIPTGLVWQPTATQPDALEVGVVVCLLVFAVYLVGFYETLQALPDPPGEPLWSDHMGQNLNLAVVPEWETGAATGQVSAARRTKGEIPPAHWPVSLQNELDNFEILIHPGDKTTELSVPKFWSAPVHHGGLMSRETAMKIGTCAEADPQTGSLVRGDACPVDARTIFVAIASYRDFECRLTVESIFSRAAHPERVRVGVVDQIVDGEDAVCNAPVLACDKDPHQALCKYKNQVDVFEMEAELSIGPVFARHVGYRMYVPSVPRPCHSFFVFGRSFSILHPPLSLPCSHSFYLILQSFARYRGEYYTTQSDAHVSYTQDWDNDIISQMEATKNEMAVLTTYLTDVQGSIDENGHSKRKTRPIMCNTKYEGGSQGMHLRHGSQPERMPSIQGLPQLQPWYVGRCCLPALPFYVYTSILTSSFTFSLNDRWAAGYSFSRGHFVVNVPYDPWQPMIFQGEEMSIGKSFARPGIAFSLRNRVSHDPFRRHRDSRVHGWL